MELVNPNQPSIAWKFLLHWVIPKTLIHKIIIPYNKRYYPVILFFKPLVTARQLEMITQVVSVSMSKCILVKIIQSKEPTSKVIFSKNQELFRLLRDKGLSMLFTHSLLRKNLMSSKFMNIKFYRKVNVTLLLTLKMLTISTKSIKQCNQLNSKKHNKTKFGSFSKLFCN